MGRTACGTAGALWPGSTLAISHRLDQHPRMGRALRRLVLGTAIVAVAAAAAWSLNRYLAPKPAPDARFVTIEGQTIRLADWRGKVVLIEFWATSCVICLAEMPSLAALHRSLAPKGFEMVAVAMPYDRPDYVLDYARRHRPPFAIALDPVGAHVGAFGPVPGTPTRLLVDRDGRVIARQVGRADLPRLRELIERALG